MPVSEHTCTAALRAIVAASRVHGICRQAVSSPQQVAGDGVPAQEKAGTKKQNGGCCEHDSIGNLHAGGYRSCCICKRYTAHGCHQRCETGGKEAVAGRVGTAFRG